jgi:Uridylate kinase
MDEGKPAYRRVLLKLSGEALLGSQPYGIDFKKTRAIAAEVKQIHDLGVDVAIMIGGGNIFRGARGVAEGMDRVSAVYIGTVWPP